MNLCKCDDCSDSLLSRKAKTLMEALKTVLGTATVNSSLESLRSKLSKVYMIFLFVWPVLRKTAIRKKKSYAVSNIQNHNQLTNEINLKRAVILFSIALLLQSYPVIKYLLTFKKNIYIFCRVLTFIHLYTWQKSSGKPARLKVTWTVLFEELWLNIYCI